ncbi:hypothetical protein C7401_12545 [Paraburkholderia unamae]|uniref:hypothetical protein n=1 Tax=Paraburkholderia unamae TaxID=219649 RepID=UPI000DC44B3E|nr:hypothetical protein [Paraburkholderia unamae]RAR54214.1 hypothetical protein C7401_12545 [Paraburkholderia unamae]
MEISDNDSFFCFRLPEVESDDSLYMAHFSRDLYVLLSRMDAQEMVVAFEIPRVKVAKSRRLSTEALVRTAIGQGIRDGVFASAGSAWLEFDLDSPTWAGDLQVSDLQ